MGYFHIVTAAEANVALRITDERQNIARIVNRSGSRYGLRFHVTQNASWSNFVNDWEISRDECEFFHFSGHAGEDRLCIGDTDINADRFAEKLAEAPRLKVVFLNGCSTALQADKIFEKLKNVAVIVTKRAIEGNDAHDFATRFYDALISKGKQLELAYKYASEPFELGARQKRFLICENGLEFTNYITRDSRVVTTRGLRMEDKLEGNDWLLFFRDENTGRLLKQWQLTERELGCKKRLIDPEIAYICDRSRHSRIFTESFNRNETGIRHYFTCSEKERSPVGLSRKIVYETITENKQTAPPYSYTCDPADSDKITNIVELDGQEKGFADVAFKIYKKISLSGESETFAASPEKFLTLKSISGYRFAVVFIEISSQDLSKNSITAIFQFINELAKNSKAVRNCSILFFWHIHMHRNVPRIFQFRFMVAHQIGAVLKRLCECERSITDFQGKVKYLNDKNDPIDTPDKDKVKEWLDEKYNPKARSLSKTKTLENVTVDHHNVIDLEACFADFIYDANNTSIEKYLS